MTLLTYTFFAVIPLLREVLHEFTERALHVFSNECYFTDVAVDICGSFFLAHNVYFSTQCIFCSLYLYGCV